MEQTSWIVAGLSAGLFEGSVMPVKTPGKDLAVWRQRSGQANAVEDRCPHRGMRFSMGFVRGDQLACRYHGWEFDGTGVCKNIPAHPNLQPPKTICAKTFACQEVNGFILVHVGDDSAAMPAEYSELEGENMVPVRSVYLDASISTVRDWLMQAVFPTFAAGQDGTGTPVTYIYGNLNDNLVRISAQVGATTEELILALQALDDDRTGVHVQVSDMGSKEEMPAVQRHVARWLADLRLRLESNDQSQINKLKISA